MLNLFKKLVLKDVTEVKLFNPSSVVVTKEKRMKRDTDKMEFRTLGMSKEDYERLMSVKLPEEYVTTATRVGATARFRYLLDAYVGKVTNVETVRKKRKYVWKNGYDPRRRKAASESGPVEVVL